MTKDKKYDYAIIIGRFQPFHNGHRYLVERAFKLANNVLILVGSANRCKTSKNPFDYSERTEMILRSLNNSGFINNVHTIPIDDYYPDEKWKNELIKKVNNEIGDNKNVVLIGHEKDHSSYYLKLFPEWEYENIDNHATIHASTIRKHIYRYINNAISHMKTKRDLLNYLKGACGDVIVDYLWTLINDFSLHDVALEYESICEYKESWSKAPYPPILLTVDALVTLNKEKVLLIKRKLDPGKGLLAFPGGFVDQTNTMLNNCIRELKEETNIKIDDETLIDSVIYKEIFDAPDRGLRGRTITELFWFDLKGDIEDYPIKAADDAAAVNWVDLNFDKLDGTRFHDDHYLILDYVINTISKPKKEIPLCFIKEKVKKKM